MATTTAFARTVVELARQPLPSTVAECAWRSLYNVLGTAVSAALSDAVDVVLRRARHHGGAPTAPVLGRVERLDRLDAALAGGIAAHYDDFDDTHLETVIHPGAACLGAVLALAEERGSSGRQVLTAFALGCEAQLRLGLAISPSHYDDGWHITGTCGSVGAAVTASLLLGLDADAVRHAIGLAASQTVGLREAFGTHTKPFHAGRASANGVLAALLAAEGMTGPTDPLEGRRGFRQVLSDEPAAKLARQLDAMGTTWELERNTFKPYPCGIVSHPAIDAAVAVQPCLRDAVIESVEVRCHPLVPELTGNPDPMDGLQARFSTIHGVAVGLLDGSVGLAQYGDERVRRDDVVGIRRLVHLVPDADVDRDAATLTVTVSGGEQLIERVEHARGSLARPLSDRELTAKVDGLVEPVLPGRGALIRAAVESLGTASSVAPLVRLCTPEEPTASREPVRVPR